MITLYQFPSCPFCAKVRDFMDENKIEYEIINVDRNNKPKEVLEASTSGTVPVIIDGENKPMAESSDIIEYLKNKYLN
jgi:glutathione S-transferase